MRADSSGVHLVIEWLRVAIPSSESWQHITTTTSWNARLLQSDALATKTLAIASPWTTLLRKKSLAIYNSAR